MFAHSQTAGRRRLLHIHDHNILGCTKIFVNRKEILRLKDKVLLEKEKICFG